MSDEFRYLEFDGAAAAVAAARAEAEEAGEPSLAPPTELHDCERGTIELALAAPRASFAGTELYPTLHAKAAVLLYTLAKSQACVDGNKRVALILLRAFLYINGGRLDAVDETISDKILEAAASARPDRQAAIIALTAWLEDAVVTAEEAP